MALKEALAEAYQIDQVRGDRTAALASLRKWVQAGDDERKAAAAEEKNLADMLRVRGEGGQHIAKVYRDLLRGALA